MYPHGLQHELVANEDLEVDHVARSDTKKKNVQHAEYTVGEAC